MAPVGPVDHLAERLRLALAGLEPDLADVVAAWPTLPPAIRAGILTMAQAAKGDV